MSVAELEKKIAWALGEEQTDLVIKNCRMVDVYNHKIQEGSVAISKGKIVGLGEGYVGREEYDAKGRYLVPAFIESHIHIESSYLSPEEFAKVVVPLGTGTIIADPHEIANVCGAKGIKYMAKAAAQTPLDVKLMLPSCVPATNFEHSGATLDADEVKRLLEEESVWGLGEMMNYPGLLHKEQDTLQKIEAALSLGKIIDGHAPFLTKQELVAYASSGIKTDHECSTVGELTERISLGMYVQLRNGAACSNLKPLLKGVTAANYRRCLLCSDDIHPQNILHRGHINADVKICIEEGLTPFQAISMATLNVAECYKLKDRGALAPGLRADFCLWEDLTLQGAPHKVWLAGKLVAQDGTYLPETVKASIEDVANTMHVKGYELEKLKLKLTQKKVRTIKILPGEVITECGSATIATDAAGDFLFNPHQDIVKIAVLERHKGLGTVGVGLLENFTLKRGALAVTVAHDSHNLIVTGTNNADMDLAVRTLLEMGGGICLVLHNEVIAKLPLPLAGLMSTLSAQEVEAALEEIHALCHKELGIGFGVDPLITLSFMALPVIPHLKITDQGLFDVDKFSFCELELQSE